MDETIHFLSLSYIYILDWKGTIGDISEDFPGRKKEFKLHKRGLVCLTNRPNTVSSIKNLLYLTPSLYPLPILQNLFAAFLSLAATDQY